MKLLPFKDSVFAQSSTPASLEGIIDDIRSGAYKDIVDEIRVENTPKSIRAELKKKLPAFIVDVSFADNAPSLSRTDAFSATGIIQFDIDDYDVERSKKSIQTLTSDPSVLYAFLSPSGGIKFGVLTDFECSDSTINHKHRIAYSMVKECLSSDLHFTKNDDAVSSVSQQCLVSYDPDAYYNASATKLVINESINDKHREQQEHFNAIEVGATTTASDKEVIELLSSIPHVLPYEKRRDINFAVIDHFRDAARPHLLSHWIKRDRKKLEGQIDAQIKSHKTRKDRKISVRTLFDQAWKNGWRGRSIIKEAQDLEPTFHSPKYFTPQESTEHLEEIIHNNFFRKKKDQMVIVECGSGKTRTMFRFVSEFVFANPRTKVAIFLKTHKMMEQFVEDMNKNIRKHNDEQIEDSGFRGMETQYPFFHRPHRMKGMKESCKELDREGSGITEDNIEVIGTSRCDDCYYRNFESCEYFEQYEDFFGKVSNIRIYTHNRLFLRPKIDKDFHPDYIVIDEDIISMMTETKKTLLSISESKYPSLTKILASISDRKETLVEATAPHWDGIYSDYMKVKDELNNLNQKIKNSDKTLLVKSIISFDAYDKLLKAREVKIKEMSLFEELIALSSGIKKQSKNVWVQHRENDAPRLTYGHVKTILDEYQDTPMLYMDASGDQLVIDTLLERDFEFHDIPVVQQENASVYQIQNHTYSKSSFQDDSEGKKIDEITDWIDTLETDTCGLIRYMRINKDKQFFKQLDHKINQINGGTDCIGWFGDIRGINRFETCDTLLVLGQHRLPDHQIFNLSQLIFREDIVDQSRQVEVAEYAKYLKKERMNKVFRMKDGKHKSIQQDDYTHPECFYTSNHFDKAETYQALHRIRLIHGTEHKQVFIFSNTPLDVSVDALLDRNKELGSKNIHVIKHIEENHFLIDANDAFIDAFQWNPDETKRFRDQRGSGQWMKQHRSLLHWSFHTKDRKSGKVYSWHDQSEQDVREWLETDQGLQIKSVAH